MQVSDCASVFGRHEFLIRRRHSLSGLIPIGGYLAFHLATNAAILDGVPAYQHRADQIHRLGPTTILVLEWSVIFLPILFHAAVGTLIVCRGKRNLAQYSYTGNFRYTLQRATGVIAMLFILWHVFQMHGWFRWNWWVETVARPLGGRKFDPANAMTAPELIQSSWVFVVLYATGTLPASTTWPTESGRLGITWGVWTSPRAQRLANIPCMVGGLLLAVVGMGALYGMYTADLTAVPEGEGGPAPAHVRSAIGSESPVVGIELTAEGSI